MRTHGIFNGILTRFDGMLMGSSVLLWILTGLDGILMGLYGISVDLNQT